MYYYYRGLDRVKYRSPSSVADAIEHLAEHIMVKVIKHFSDQLRFLITVKFFDSLISTRLTLSVLLVTAGSKSAPTFAGLRDQQRYMYYCTL